MRRTSASITLEVDDKGTATFKKFDKQVTRSFDKLKRHSGQSVAAAGRMERAWNKTLKGINFKALGVAAAGAAVAVGMLASKAIKAASKLQEATSKFNVVFKEQLASAKAWAKTLVDSYAMSMRAAKQYLSSIQDLLVPMGMQALAAGKLSFSIVKLSKDLASFNDLDTADVMRDIQSALTGEYQTMKKYGVILSATTVQEKALTMGLANTKKGLTAAHKAQAAYSIIVKDSAAAIGDHARTQNDYANMYRKVTNQIEDALAKLGTELLPVVTAKLTEMSNWITNNQESMSSFFKTMGEMASMAAKSVKAIATAFNAVGTAMGTGMGAVVTWIETAIRKYGEFAAKARGGGLDVEGANAMFSLDGGKKDSGTGTWTVDHRAAGKAYAERGKAVKALANDWKAMNAEISTGSAKSTAAIVKGHKDIDKAVANNIKMLQKYDVARQRGADLSLQLVRQETLQMRDRGLELVQQEQAEYDEHIKMAQDYIENTENIYRQLRDVKMDEIEEVWKAHDESNEKMVDSSFDAFNAIGQGMETILVSQITNGFTNIGDVWKGVLNDMVNTWAHALAKMVRTWLATGIGKLFTGEGFSGFSLDSLMGGDKKTGTGALGTVQKLYSGYKAWSAGGAALGGGTAVSGAGAGAVGAGVGGGGSAAGVGAGLGSGSAWGAGLGGGVAAGGTVAPAAGGVAGGTTGAAAGAAPWLGAAGAGLGFAAVAYMAYQEMNRSRGPSLSGMLKAKDAGEAWAYGEDFGRPVSSLPENTIEQMRDQFLQEMVGKVLESQSGMTGMELFESGIGETFNQLAQGMDAMSGETVDQMIESAHDFVDAWKGGYEELFNSQRTWAEQTTVSVSETAFASSQMMQDYLFSPTAENFQLLTSAGQEWAMQNQATFMDAAGTASEAMMSFLFDPTVENFQMLGEAERAWATNAYGDVLAFAVNSGQAVMNSFIGPTLSGLDSIHSKLSSLAGGVNIPITYQRPGEGKVNAGIRHSGGMVDDFGPIRRLPYAHDGLQVDERLIVAQTGERVLNRQETADYNAPINIIVQVGNEEFDAYVDERHDGMRVKAERRTIGSGRIM